MFRALAAKVAKDGDLPERAWKNDVLNRVLDGTLYDVLKRTFHEERTSAGEYIPIRDRAPCVRYNLCRIVVSDSISLLFGESRFPTIQAIDKTTQDGVAKIVAECSLQTVMRDAAWKGSVGSAAILLRVLDGGLFFDVMCTRFLTPTWKPEAPDTLLIVRERYKARGSDLVAAGYAIKAEDMSTMFWCGTDWTEAREVWYLPWKSDETPQVDEGRTVNHALGFVPVVWLRNLPGGDKIDGWCTFQSAIETQIEIEYQLSQAARALKYSSEPTLMIKEPAADGDVIKGGGNALIVSENGDAKLLEITGAASEAVIEYVRSLREMALESVHGNRSNADKVSAAQSGRALELMHQALLWLADDLRASYGQFGLLELVRMICKASQKVPFTINGEKMPVISEKGLALRWPAWFHATERDKTEQACALKTLRDAGHISEDTAIATIASNYDIEDVKAEIARIRADETLADAREQAQVAAQTKITESAPG